MARDTKIIFLSVLNQSTRLRDALVSIYKVSGEQDVTVGGGK